MTNATNTKTTFISNFTADDISEAAYLTELTWGDEMALTHEALKHVLYEALVRYYLRSSSFSFKLSEGALPTNKQEEATNAHTSESLSKAATMQGFLLAAPLAARDSSQSWLKAALKPFASEEQDLVYNYLRYLSYNGQQVRKLAECHGALALVLYLFLSRKAGVGSTLLRNIEEVARAHGLTQLYLWADATCDYDYYLRRGYRAAGHFVNRVLPALGEQETWVYVKELEG